MLTNEEKDQIRVIALEHARQALYEYSWVKVFTDGRLRGREAVDFAHDFVVGLASVI